MYMISARYLRIIKERAGCICAHNQGIQMYPIEVKSGKQYKTTSMNNFREKYKNRSGESYIIHPRNLIIKDGIICIPPYMTMML